MLILPILGSSSLGSKTLPTSKPDHGIPEHVIEFLGPPPVLPRRVDQFFRILQALASETPPRGMSDWLLLWDMAVARIDLNQIGAAKVAATMLLTDQAAIEIVRRDRLRFVGQPPSESMGRDFEFGGDIAEMQPPEVDMAATRSVLKRIGLDESAVQDLAYLMAFSILTPLETLAAAKQGVERTSRNELERRHARQDQSQALHGGSQILDAEFVSASTSADEAIGLDQTPPAEQARHARPAALPIVSALAATAGSVEGPGETETVIDDAGVA